MTKIIAAKDMSSLLWLIAEKRVDVFDARMVPLLQQALNDKLVSPLSEDDGDGRLRLTDKGRRWIGLPSTRSADEEGADWLRTVGRRAFSRF
jgi:hypothetical protein